jgi:flagellar biosynthesis GTPase FlhF
MLPTLIQRGKVKLTRIKSVQERNRVKDMIAIDYIMERLENKLNLDQSYLNPKIKSWTDKILILEAFTGSGKTTTIAPEIYKRYFDKIRRNIINT